MENKTALCSDQTEPEKEMRLVDANAAPRYLNTVACKQIKDMPTINAKIIIYAHWEIAVGCNPANKVKCSNCHLMTVEPYDYCPHCGATMNEKEAEL